MGSGYEPWLLPGPSFQQYGRLQAKLLIHRGCTNSAGTATMLPNHQTSPQRGAGSRRTHTHTHHTCLRVYARTHTRTHARTHARAHTHTLSPPSPPPTGPIFKQRLRLLVSAIASERGGAEVYSRVSWVIFRLTDVDPHTALRSPAQGLGYSYRVVTPIRAIDL